MEASIVFLALFSTVAYGIADFLIIMAARMHKSTTTLLVAQSIGLAVFMFYALTSDEMQPLSSISSSVWFLLILTGILNLVAYATFYEGLATAPVAIVSPLAACAPIITVLLGMLLLHEPLSNVQAGGIALAISGAVLVSTNIAELSKAKKLALHKGAQYGLLCLVCWGIAYALFDILVENMGWVASQLMLKAMLVVFLFAYMKMRMGPILPDKPRKLFFLLVVFIGILDISASAAYSKAVTIEYTSIMFPLTSTFPVITILLARFFLNQRVQPVQYLGAALAISGIVMLTL
jgi:drug/metabolite transporter (DMT)-like permease